MADSSEGSHGYINTTWERWLVSEYTGLNFHQVGQLDYGLYLLWLRDAYIHTMERTEEGRAALADAWRMEQTKPDRPKLRAKLGKGAHARGK